MLREIKSLLQEHSPRSLKDLSIHFSVDPDALRPMLQLLEDKGQIRSIRTGCGRGCAGCTSLCEADTLYFESVTPVAPAGTRNRGSP